MSTPAVLFVDVALDGRQRVILAHSPFLGSYTTQLHVSSLSQAAVHSAAVFSVLMGV